VLELPNLEGQPGWVVVLVVALIVVGGLGAAYVRRKGGQDPETPPEIEAGPDTVALPGGNTQGLDLVREAMNHLAASAVREAESAEEAEREARELQRQLNECTRERDRLEGRIAKLEAELRECQFRAQYLSDRREGTP
jgi:hypothetical protein